MRILDPVLRWRRRVLWCVDKHTARGLEIQRQQIESRQRRTQKEPTMTPWKFDVDPNDPLVALRVPVAPVFPEWGYFAVFHEGSGQRPTDHEALMISSFIAEAAAEWQIPVTNAGLDGEPFDWFPGYNTVVLHKYAANDWGYRRRTWPEPQFYPPPPESRFEKPVPLSLMTVLDLVHTRNSGERPSDEWMRWKKDHPDVFGN